jgi:hypothetical protein
MEKETQTPNYLEDIVRYQYANAAGRLISDEKTAPFAKGALEKLLEQMDPASREIAEGFVEGAFASEEGIKKAIGINDGKYQRALDGLDVSEFYGLRLKTLNSLLGEKEAGEASAVFEKYKGQTVGSIIKKIAQASAILKDKTGLFDDEKKEEAKKTIEKLGYINNIITLLENRNYEELMPSATKSTYESMISEALKKA